MPRRRILNLNIVEKTIPANDSITVDASGVRLLCKESDDTFQLRIDDSPKIPFEAGLTFDLTEDPEYLPGDQFKRLTLINDTSTAIDVSLYTLGPGLKDSRFNNLLERNISVRVVSAPSRIVATEDSLGAGLTIAVAASATILGSNLGDTRNEITVTNMSEDDDLYILSLAGKWIATVFPRSGWTKNLSETVQLKVPSTASASVICTVLEQYPI